MMCLLYQSQKKVNLININTISTTKYIIFHKKVANSPVFILSSQDKTMSLTKKRKIDINKNKMNQFTNKNQEFLKIFKHKKNFIGKKLGIWFNIKKAAQKLMSSSHSKSFASLSNLHFELINDVVHFPNSEQVFYFK